MPPRAPGESADPYVVLGVSRNATDAEIRAAYHALVAQYHPDRHQGNPLADLANERMAEINRAYEALSQRSRAGGNVRSASPSPEGAAAGASRGARAAAPAPGTRGGGFRRGGPSKPQPLARRLFRGALFLLALPFLLRMAPRLVRLFAGMGRVVFDGAVRMRGTPLVALGVLVTIALLVLVVIRRRRATPRRDE